MSVFSERLLAWHHDHGRHTLPWQNTRDPYQIWLSEIMLQQTQVETVIPYYERFLSQFPDIATLAAAPLDDVLAHWSGLGYYARARNLHKSAQAIVAQHAGGFPRTAQELCALPGIGRSTAAAIAAFAFGEKGAILDGNVKRVLCRAFGVEGFPGQREVEKDLWALADSLLPETRIEAYTQAQMDLGATLCTRSRPQCHRCPLAPECVALQRGAVAALPTRKPKKAVPQRSVRVAVVQHGERILLERRPPTGIWGGLLSLPEMPHAAEEDGVWLARSFGVEARETAALSPLRHVFTHFRLDIHPVHFQVDAGHAAGDASSYVWHPLGALDVAGLPAPVRRILAALGGNDLFSQDPANENGRR